jgi:subtilisin family serine protease
MRNTVFTTEALPTHHDNLLIVRVRKEILAGFAAATPTGALPPGIMGGVSGPATTVGLGALSFYERAGAVKRVVPLRRDEGRAAQAPGSSALSALMFSPPMPAKEDPNDGVSIIELERGHDPQQLQIALANDPNVLSVSKVPCRYLTARPSRPRAALAPTVVQPGTTVAAVPPAVPIMWNLAKISWEQARGRSGFQDADRIRVAVLDTGVDDNHPELAGRIHAYDWQHSDLAQPTSAKDIIGHGTHVSGTIAATVNNRLGVKGICTCTLSVWKIFDDEPTYAPGLNAFIYYVNPVMYRRALAACVESPVDVMNLSIGGPAVPDAQEKLLFDQLLAAGVTVSAAMGNDRQHGSPTSYPAAIPGLIAVGATGLDDNIAVFSNAGNHIAISAPGKAIWSTLPTYPGQTGFGAAFGPDGTPRQGKPMRREINYDAWDGTSMATPHITGAVALLTANKGRREPAQARLELMQSADKIAGLNGADFNSDYGAGRLNLFKLLHIGADT